MNIFITDENVEYISTIMLFLKPSAQSIFEYNNYIIFNKLDDVTIKQF